MATVAVYARIIVIDDTGKEKRVELDFNGRRSRCDVNPEEILCQLPSRTIYGLDWRFDGLLEGSDIYIQCCKLRKKVFTGANALSDFIKYLTGLTKKT